MVVVYRADLVDVFPAPAQPQEDCSELMHDQAPIDDPVGCRRPTYYCTAAIEAPKNVACGRVQGVHKTGK
jgi:hypothetical protein